MSSKICPKCCKRVSVTRFEPRFCPWDCGSLENEPIVPELKSYQDFLDEQAYLRALAAGMTSVNIDVVPKILENGQVCLFVV